MPTLDHEKLREINTFPSLIKYLRDELEWPIEQESFDDLTFDYEPEELGLDPKTAAKIDSIKQLRPLNAKQPWGIFFVKFEPKRLPVVALRRILSQLIFKKRASANKADRQAWNTHDLLFISNYGEGEHREITFAHFSESPTNSTDLPLLKVLGWDGDNTVARLDHTHHTLKEKLRWPVDIAFADSWRKTWSEAFTLHNREVINTTKELCIRMAHLATAIRKKVNAILKVESDKGPLTQLMKGFQQALIHDLTPDDFADMYAQTITYGMLSARISRHSPDDSHGGLVAENIVDMVPVTNPFLRELLSAFLTVGGRKGKLDFDELGINDVVEALRKANMGAVLRDFGDKNPQEDPVIHFYELFLKEYDAKKRMQRGVFYTPKPVVSYIVRSVHELLQSEFGLADGLADTATWADMLKKQKDLKLPTIETLSPTTHKLETHPIDPNTPFVMILDPATGTATFLVEVIDIIHKTMRAKWHAAGRSEKEIESLWQDYVADHLLPRLHGYELMMAPYAIAHMKIGLKLFDTGYKFSSHERARVYLTNSLEPPQDFSDKLAFDAPALAHEAQAVNAVKRHQRFTVVIGNPPYSKLSANWNEWIDSLLHGRGSDAVSASNYYVVDGAGLGERTVWIQDDYIKFTRLSQWHIDRTGAGIHSYISNNGYLDNPTLRGMRQQLRSSFSRMYLYDLHGSMKRGEIGADGNADGNVFDIQQGVSIGIFVKVPSHGGYIRHADLWGDRDFKYRTLLANPVSRMDWSVLNPCSPFHLFVPVDSANQAEYDLGWKMTDIFSEYHTGIITKRDALTIHWTKADVLTTVSDFVSLTPKAASEKYQLPEDVRDWKVAWAQADLRKTGISKDRAIPVLYRPFDVRFTYFTGHTRGFVGWPVAPMTELMRSGDNLALITTRMTKGEDFAHVMASQWMAEVICLSSKTSNNGFVFPMYVNGDGELLKSRTGSRESNVRPQFTKQLPAECEPHEILAYVFAILHSPVYRKRYREFLSRDFPRIPLPRERDTFHSLALHGEELLGLHLLKSTFVSTFTTSYRGPDTPEVEKVIYANGTAYLDKRQTCGFTNVPEAVWNFHIGGYQVCEKWLKDRKGRTLSKDDIAHYQKIIVALSETIRLMKEIDQTIEKHGGWPGAFVTDKPAAASAAPAPEESPHPKA